MWIPLLIPITLAATAVLAASEAAVVGANRRRFSLESRSGHDTGSEEISKRHPVVHSDGTNSSQLHKLIHHHYLTDELVRHPNYPDHLLRIKQPKLCSDKAMAYSGYVDIGNQKNLFFFYIESRSNPLKDPVVLWLNGGPGCSSMTGLFFEHGPCLVSNEGKDLELNPYSWNNKSNIIYLDSPVNVGFSISPKLVNNSRDTAEDVYAFMQIFYYKFSNLAKNNKFNIMGESYAGMYIPNIASVIFHNNKKLQGATCPGLVHIPLVSMAIGNGFVEIVSSMKGQIDYGCGKGLLSRIYNDTTCTELATQLKSCESLVAKCRMNGSEFTTCTSAQDACSKIQNPFFQLKLNPYDVTKTCDLFKDPGSLCYKELSWIPAYLNQTSVRTELGIDAGIKSFEACTRRVQFAFIASDDSVSDTTLLIPELLESGIKLLAYVGERDFLCNYLGNLDWTNGLRWKGQKGYNNAPFRTFKMPNGKLIGETKSFGAMTFLKVKDAGHMVPHDKPAEALEMVNRWLSGAWQL
ncbi:BQ2448_2614 [Microbotryum intermedium]|uniref:Carboxypeptidase n=1 Tax=Microbotryum intermedium TaxID=269621 RepID=A0A238FCI7_9BASI|nr:BQ2448_2614 [Microbotryum intermedium]